LTELTGALGHCVFAGRLVRAKLGVLERATVRAVHAPEGDYRQWDAIRAFADEIAKQLGASSAGRHAGAGLS
jgi:menaquinone-dependent protoporphyrinogen oxidase